MTDIIQGFDAPFGRAFLRSGRPLVSNHWHAQKAPNGDVLVSAVQSVLGRLQYELHSEYAGGMQFGLNCIDFCNPTLVNTSTQNSANTAKDI